MSLPRRLAAVLALSLTATLTLVTPVQASTAPAAGSQLWLRADVGVTVNSTAVTNWSDQSGAGRHAVQATAERQPALVQAALNGRPVIRFSGAQSLYMPNPVSFSSFTVFVVGRNTKPTETFSMILGPGGPHPNNQLRWENGSQALYVGTSNAMPATTVSIGNTRVYHALSLRYTGSAMSVYRDGRLVSTRTFTTTGPWTLAAVGAWYGTYFMTGDLAEVLVYPTALSDADRILTDNYLRAKYALP
ncbi:MAG TPA: LamG-like jellyroll fold domain-containing protein [Pilimelia sp.]|nr:LamG-like jellyroll fold domain-containing protein [Pilimelia sp.]